MATQADWDGIPGELRNIVYEVLHPMGDPKEPKEYTVVYPAPTGSANLALSKIFCINRQTRKEVISHCYGNAGILIEPKKGFYTARDRPLPRSIREFPADILKSCKNITVRAEVRADCFNIAKHDRIKLVFVVEDKSVFRTEVYLEHKVSDKYPTQNDPKRENEAAVNRFLIEQGMRMRSAMLEVLDGMVLEEKDKDVPVDVKWDKSNLTWYRADQAQGGAVR